MFLFEFSSFFELEILIIFDKIFDVGLGFGFLKWVWVWVCLYDNPNISNHIVLWVGVGCRVRG